MPRYFARKFQALSLVVLLVAVFGVMAAFPMPACRTKSCAIDEAASGSQYSCTRWVWVYPDGK